MTEPTTHCVHCGEPWTADLHRCHQMRPERGDASQAVPRTRTGPASTPDDAAPVERGSLPAPGEGGPAAGAAASAASSDTPIVDATCSCDACVQRTTATYDVRGGCSNCGARFIVRSRKGDRVPTSVTCPACECAAYGWPR